MARSIWKGPFVELSLLKKAETAQDSSKRTPIKTWSRRSTILPQFVGLTFNVYNGRKFIPVSVNERAIACSILWESLLCEVIRQGRIARSVWPEGHHLVIASM